SPFLVPGPEAAGAARSMACFAISRKGASMKLGIVGLGRSGKTTIFNALTRRTGESVPPGGQMVPALGTVPVPDPRVDWLSDLYHPKKTIYTQVTYTDLQGMPGVIENKQEYMALLLTHMRPMDALLMVVRNFDDSVLGPADVARDFRELEDEFIISDLATVEKRLEKLDMEQKRGKKTAGPERELLEACAEVLNAEQPLRSKPDLAGAPELRGFTFLSGKPLLVIVNNPDDDDTLPDVDFGSAEVMVVRGKLEMEMAQLPDAEAAIFREDFGIVESALDRVIQRSFALLRLICFFTVGEDEVKAWNITRDLSAQESAGAVHTDIQRGFIRAEVVAYEDLRRCGDYAAARKQGLVRLEGKTYPVQDGDIIHFRFNI
ncbi:MAG: YchF family ATPase, partial [Desulfobacteraceae bacterium]|nr:YchF family ATPase [Desulfobacteraceae bacterium]